MPGHIFTVPNQLTFLRLIILPFFIILVYYDNYRWALGVLFAAAVSDALDGVLARRLNQKSALGAYLDPIADKLLLSSSFFILAVKGMIDWWLTILVFSRDVLILIIAGVILVVSGYRPLPPTLYGKATTATQIVFIFLVISSAVFHGPLLDRTRVVFLFLVAAFTIVSGVHYSYTIARRLSGPGSNSNP